MAHGRLRASGHLCRQESQCVSSTLWAASGRGALAAADFLWLILSPAVCRGCPCTDVPGGPPKHRGCPFHVRREAVACHVHHPLQRSLNCSVPAAPCPGAQLCGRSWDQLEESCVST